LLLLSVVLKGKRYGTLKDASRSRPTLLKPPNAINGHPRRSRLQTRTGASAVKPVATA